MKFIQYIKARFEERSTWVLFGAAITGAAALSWPWSLVSAVIGIIAALIPDGPVK